MVFLNKEKVVILCGGKGTRLREETEFKPKPLVEIGGLPILWHVMKIYSYYGYNDFILCLGYKGRMIKQFFMEYEWENFDFTMNLKSKDKKWYRNYEVEDWNITFANTGDETLTGGRVKKIEKYIKDDNFMLTYGDGVGDINIQKLFEFHKKLGKIATLTGIHPLTKYGLIKINHGFEVLDFQEKPKMEDLINAGFMVLKSDFFDYIKSDCMFESNVLPELSKTKQVALYEHPGFWGCMDTYKDFIDLNKMWQNNPKWKIWE